MLQKTKLKLVFWLSLILGSGLCIGGIFLSPLLVPGGILIAGALAMYQSAYVGEEVLEHNEHQLEMVKQPCSGIHEKGVEITQNIGLFFLYSSRSEPEPTIAVIDKLTLS